MPNVWYPRSSVFVRVQFRALEQLPISTQLDMSAYEC